MQVCERTGVPVQPEGDDVSMVLVSVPSGWHAPQEEYVYVQAEGADDPRAAAMAWTCAVVSFDREFMAPTVVMALCIWATVAPFTVLVASWLWHELQLLV